MSGVFLFHRDFRTTDNTSLIELSKVSKCILPIFVFTPEQVSSSANKYYNSNAIQFMCESLEELNKNTQQKLACFYGDTLSVLNALKARLPDWKYLAFNLDYTKYARERTDRVQKWCASNGIECIAHEDYTMVPMQEVRNGEKYTVFKPYFDRVMSLSRSIRVNTRKINSFCLPSGVSSIRSYLPLSKIHNFYKQNEYLSLGGRSYALQILSNIKKFRQYAKVRNTPSIDTTQLSAHIKFGNVSIREVFEKFRSTSLELTRQLVWHDFYAQLMFYMPYRQTLGGGNFQNKRVRWSSSASRYRAWCDGRTGFPIVDAGMRQLNTIGWMHNRVRLIVSNFLTLVLGVDWRLGEKYFAQKLVDYDPSSNNGNWQFTAQVGIDRVPYVRIYNPFTQAKDVDPKCEYIKLWVHELRPLDADTILRWNNSTPELSKAVAYPMPIVDYERERRIQEAKYRKK